MKISIPLALILLSASSEPAFSFITPSHGSRNSRVTPLHSANVKDGKIDVSSLPLPPNQGMNFYRSIRDSLSYMFNPDRFVADRTTKLGPVFLTYQFFRPTVFCGGQEAVKEFITGTEIKASVTYPALPESFVNLHTKWGSLNMDISDPMFKETRVLFGDVLSSRKALGIYSNVVEKQIQQYVDELADRVREDPNQPIYLAAELKSLCLQMFSEIFSGKGLTKEQEQQFIDYNAALLSLRTKSNQYKIGEKALKDLKVEMLKRFRALDDPNISPETPGRWYHDQIFGRPNFDDEDRISTVIVLYVWGAYVECASLMADSLAMTHIKEINLDVVRDEYKAREESGLSPSDPSFWEEKDMAYTNGIMRETLRLYPPGAGVPRFGQEDFALAGYRIPAETPVMLEPRIGNMDPNLYDSPEDFQPLRWVPEKTSSSSCPFQGSARKLGLGSWFPGGNGAHQCPGVPLAEMVGRIFMSKMAMKFDSWTFSGEGLTKDGDIDYVMIPVRIPPDNFGMKFKLSD